MILFELFNILFSPNIPFEFYSIFILNFFSSISLFENLEFLAVFNIRGLK